MHSTSSVPLELIEQYVLGQLDPARAREVEAAAVKDASVREAVGELRAALEQLARSRAVAPPAGLKERLLSKLAVPEAERLTWPPVIHERSRISDYDAWINVPGMVRPSDAGELFFIPFADNADGVSALVWLVSGSPEEIHTAEIEKFLVVEGSCEISMRGEVHTLAKGDVMSIPLHTPHTVKVTSGIPCKLVLQRIAA